MKLEIALYQALTSINVSEQKANAVIEAMEADLNTFLATKVDIANLQTQIAQLEAKLTLRLGFMLSAAVGVLIGVMKLMQ